MQSLGEFIFDNLRRLAAWPVRYKIREEGDRAKAVIIYVDGVMLEISHYGHEIRTRTAAGGWSVALTGGGTQPLSNDKCMEKLHSLMGCVMSYKAPPRKKRKSKSNIGPPSKFNKEAYCVHHGVASSTSVLDSCEVTEVVSIANNLKLVDASKPESPPWFLMYATYSSSGIVEFIYNDSGYYAIDRRTRKVVDEWTMRSLNVVDKMLIDAAVSAYIGAI